MSKIKKLFLGMFDSVKEAFDRFPITIIIIFILTIICTIFLVDSSNFDKSTIENVQELVIFGIFWGVGTLLTESIYGKSKDLRKIIGIIISFVIAFVVDRLIECNFLETVNWLWRWISSYLIICPLISVYILEKKSNLSFEKYILNLFLNVKSVSIVFGIISIGILILYAIFTILILDSLKFSFALKILCLFFGFYYVPVFIKAFSDNEAEDTKFNKAVFSKVLLPLLIAAMAIVYVYIIKIFFITEVPKNELFRILSAIFVCAFPIYIINKNYFEEDSILKKVVFLIPYLYIPFIFLQIYSIGIRINEYGLTTSRYIACALIVYETIAIIFSILKNSKYLRELIIATIIWCLIVVISPYNFEEFPKKSQRKIVDNYISQGISFDDYSEKDKKKYSSAYQYIAYDDNYSNVNLSENEKEKLLSYKSYNNSSYNQNDEKIEENIYKSKTLDNLDISNYSKIYSIKSAYKKDSISNIEIYTENDTIKIEANIEEYLKQIMKAYQNSPLTADRLFKEISIVNIDEKYDIYITELSINYYIQKSEIDYVRIDGYILEK